MRIILVFCCFLSVSLASNGEKECGENEVWKECMKENCGEFRCNQTDFKCGNQGCISKCFCKFGFFRSLEGKCERSCPCGEGEFFNPCSDKCELKCGELFKPCPLSCFPGFNCHCKDNYRRNIDGICIHEEKCPQ